MAIGIMTCHFTSAQDLNGVKINAVMNCEQVISKFGEPSKYAERDSGDLGVDKYYYYGYQQNSKRDTRNGGIFL